MATTKILCGSSVRQDPTVLNYHLKSLAQQEIPKGADIEYWFVDDSDDAKTKDIILEHLPANFLPSDPRPEDAHYAVTRGTHRWNEATFDHLAKQKQKLLDKVLEDNFTHAFLVDSDLLLDPKTLASLYAAEKPVNSAVFWTCWTETEPRSMGPNVWLRNPYEQDGLGLSQNEFWRRLAERKLTRVFGGGACHLVHRSVLEAGVRYFPRLPGLPKEGMWQGEDRTFAILAFQLHQIQWADPWPYIYHAYHPHMRDEAELKDVFDNLSSVSNDHASYGDLVNFTVQHLEEPNLKDQVFSIRGRLGGLTLAPEIEKTLLELPVGQEAIIEVAFPVWWPELSGTRRTLVLRLIDARPYGFPPILIDHAFAGLR
jgi:hypothetical protein